jgi:predicted RNase H-like HicB family nuclease
MNYLVDINWDEEAAVWYAVCDEIPLALESGSFDALIERVKIVALEVLELNNNEKNPTQLCIKSTRMEKIA